MLLINDIDYAIFHSSMKEAASMQYYIVTFLKAIFICFTIPIILLLAGYMIYIYSSELIERNIFVYMLSNEPVLFYQTPILCFLGYLLCRNEMKNYGVTPAAHQKVMTQFIKQFGKRILLFGMIAVFFYPASNFADMSCSGSSLYHLPRFGNWRLDTYNFIDILFRYSINPMQIITYWLMYVTYAITKSYYQVKQRKSVQVSSD